MSDARAAAQRADGSPFCDSVMRRAVASGLVGANINYRLAPEHAWPSGVEDLDDAVAWLHEHIADYGGDPERVFLWRHSAGAAHAADYLAQAAREERDDGVAGAILTSGFYWLGDAGPSVWSACYGEDTSQYEARSSLPGLVQPDTPLLVSEAELDPPMFRAEAERLERRLAGADRPAQRLRRSAHSHLPATYAVGTPDRSLSGPVPEFIARVSAGD